MLKKLTPFIILTVVAAIVFSAGLFSSSNEINSGDNRPLIARTMTRSLEHSIGNQGWLSWAGIGRAGGVIPPTHRLLAAKLFSPVFYLKFMYFISILLGGIFFYLLLRDYGLIRPALLFGAISWMLSNTVLTLVLPGHLGKIMVLSFIPLAFLFIRRAVLREAWINYLYTGLVIGSTLLFGAFQMAFNFGVLLLLYWTYLLVKKRDGKPLRAYVREQWKTIALHKAGLLALGIIALITAASAIPSVFSAGSTRTSQKSHRNNKLNWQWATQWSVPPTDLADIIVPGLSGWKTGDPEYPYLGNLGWSPWDNGKTQRNLKLAVDYLGMIPFLFMAAAIFLLWKEKTSELKFWLTALLIAVVLALGRHLYLPYYLFYNLPYMDTVRNPNRFMKIFAFAGVLLASFGFHRVFSKEDSDSRRIGKFIKFLKYFTISLVSLTALSVVFGSAIRNFLVRSGANTGAAANIAGYWPLAFLIASVLSAAVWYSFKLLLPTGKNSQPDRFMKYAPLMLVFLTGAELWYSAAHFIGYRDTGNRYESNALISLLEKPGIPTRTFFLTHPNLVNPDYRAPIAESFQYYNINLLTFNELIQPPGDRAAILASSGLTGPLHQLVVAAVNRKLSNDNQFVNGFKYLKLNGISHLAVFGELESKEMKKVRGFLLRQNQPPLTFYRYTGAMPRVSMQYRYRVFSSPKDASSFIASSNYVLTNGICLDQDGLRETGNPVLPPPLKEGITPVSRIAVREYGNNRITMEVFSSVPGLLTILDSYSPYWKATVNGKAAPIIPANVQFRAIPVPKGSSRITLQFSPSSLPLNLTLAGYGIVLLVLAGDFFRRHRRKKRPDNK